MNGVQIMRASIGLCGVEPWAGFLHINFYGKMKIQPGDNIDSNSFSEIRQMRVALSHLLFRLG